MRRFAHPNEIARSIVYLLADATFTTGSTQLVEGSQSIQ
jgi:NAD(P)-dependent dehydrogenase (short-subunit alcohol dehydrogenase family)